MLGDRRARAATASMVQPAGAVEPAPRRHPRGDRGLSRTACRPPQARAGHRRRPGHRPRAGLRRRAVRRVLRARRTARWWSTRWRRGRTTAATTAWTPATSRSSSCRCARWRACRWRSRASTARRSCSTCWATCGSRGAKPKRTPPWDAVLALPGTHLHLYGKLSARRGRKMGHLTITGPTVQAVRATALKAAGLLGIAAVLSRR